MVKQDPAKWAMHVYCKVDYCIYNEDGNCVKDHIYIDRFESCDDVEEEETE